jgi:hypothetical protein
MSEWPTRYLPETNGTMCSSKDGDWVQYDSFERLLTFTVNSLSPCHPGPGHLDKLKESILLQLKKR